MSNDKKIILFGAGKTGREALYFYGFSNVFCFVDNKKNGQLYCGKNIISLEELQTLKTDYRVVIAVGEYFLQEVAQQLKKLEIDFSIFAEEKGNYFSNYIIPNEKIAKLHNIHSGEEIFLIGNGPSLKTEDLDVLSKQNVVCMACNFINKVFDKTNWRPDYYCNVETSAILTNLDFINNVPLKAKFIKNFAEYVNFTEAAHSAAVVDTPDNDVCLFNYCYNNADAPMFSEDVSKIVYNGSTVMFLMIEFAVYMGFSRIYLLGVDNTQPPFVHTTSFLESKSHFYEENENELKMRQNILPEHNHSEKDDWTAYQNRVNAFYCRAREYAEDRSIIIRNATRGGELEVFERVNFDLLFVDRR